MILSERWGGETRKFIRTDKVVRVFGAWMSGDEIPAGGGPGGFRAKPGSKMLLQIFVILSPPADRALMSLAMASGVERLELFGILKNF